MDADPAQTVVLTGIGDAGLEWAILARDLPNGEFSTFIRRTIGDQRATSGFIGVKLDAERLIHFWTGKADGTPFFVLARTAPQVEAVIAVGASGAEYPLQLSDVIEQFGLRFGATPIPDYDTVVSIRTLPPSSVHPVMRPFRPEHLPPGGSGWYPIDEANWSG